MANDALIDFQGDGASSDTILSYVHIQTAGYSGSYNDYVVPAAANFPLAGKDSSGGTVNPSRYIVRLNFTPFSNANLPILLKDVTSGGTSLTPVTGSPSLNQYRWWYSANNNTASPDVIEFNSGQSGHTIAIDCYAKQSILHSDQVNNPNTLGGDLHFTSTTDSTSKDTGALILEGGLGIEKNLFIGGNVNSTGGYSIIYRNSSGVESANHILTKIIEIGNWNMDSTVLVDIVHGLDYTKIFNINVMIYADDGTLHSVTGASQSGSTLGLMQVFIYGAFPTYQYIRLFRTDNGLFDSTAYDSTSFNRGFIIINYFL